MLLINTLTQLINKLKISTEAFEKFLIKASMGKKVFKSFQILIELIKLNVLNISNSLL